MALRICISGFGRVGRAIFRANWEQGNNFEVAAIKDIMPVENSAYLLKHDSHYGEFEEDIKVMGENLVIGGIELPYFKEKENSKIPLNFNGEPPARRKAISPTSRASMQPF